MWWNTAAVRASLMTAIVVALGGFVMTAPHRIWWRRRRGER